MTPNRRKPGRPAATDSAETRRALIEAARQCFGLYGFDKTSNGDIVKRAGVTTGPLYHHFGSKAELYGAVANDSIDPDLQPPGEHAREHGGQRHCHQARSRAERGGRDSRPR